MTNFALVQAGSVPSASAKSAADLIAQGDMARDRRHYADAAAAYGEALREAPLNWAVWVQLGHMRKEAGDLDGAERAYGRAIALAPQVADTWLMVGHLLRLQGRWFEAAAAYARAGQLEPDNQDAEREFLDLEQQGFASDALPALAAEPLPASEEPRSATPERRKGLLTFDFRRPLARARVGKADAARDRGDWRAAAAGYARALDLAPDMAPIWVQLGHAHKESRDFPAAETAYRRALTLTPDDADIWLNFGHLRKLMGQPQAAVEAYARAVALDAASPARGELDRLAEAGFAALEVTQVKLGVLTSNHKIVEGLR